MKTEKYCKHCDSTDVVKDGRSFCHTIPTQIFLCKSCGKKWHVRLTSKQERRPPFIPEITPPEKETVLINWPAYNDAQTQEKLMFLELLNSLCAFIPETENGQVGRPKVGLQEMTFCLVAKLYEGLSSRRVSSDLELAMRKGHISRVPHFNTMLNYFNDPQMTPILEALIRFSALPLKGFENVFAVDASGLSSAFYSRWLDVRLDAKKKATQDWIKVHVICGVKSNIVTAIKITDGKSNDCPHFPELVRKTAEHFRVKEVSADKAYSSRKNIDVVFEVGGIPYILFKKGATGNPRGSMAWRKMYNYCQFYSEQFIQRYHQRSNVESTFSMLKRKFSSKLMMKNEVAQVNEALAMVLCHNLCVLIKEICANGISTDLTASAHLFPELHKKAKLRSI